VASSLKRVNLPIVDGEKNKEFEDNLLVEQFMFATFSLRLAPSISLTSKMQKRKQEAVDPSNKVSLDNMEENEIWGINLIGRRRWVVDWMGFFCQK
jgi:hypothetical protein